MEMLTVPRWEMVQLNWGKYQWIDLKEMGKVHLVKDDPRCERREYLDRWYIVVCFYQAQNLAIEV